MKKLLKMPMLASIDEQARNIYLEGLRLKTEIECIDKQIEEINDLISGLLVRLAPLRKKTATDVIRRSKNGKVTFLRLKITGVAHGLIMFFNSLTLVAIVCIVLIKMLQPHLL